VFLYGGLHSRLCDFDWVGAGRGRGGGFHSVGGGHVGGGGGQHISAGRAVSRSSARPSSRGNVARSTLGNRGNRSVTARTAKVGTPKVGGRAPLNASRKAGRSALSSRSLGARNSASLRNPRTRAGVIARAATAGWHNGRGGRNGWWRHRDGVYGWVGPLFWPFAYYDMYDYAMWGNGYDASFWGYGYSDIYAGLFAPYGYDDLTGYLPEYASASPSGPAQAPSPSATAAAPNAETGRLASLCGEDSRDIAGLPIDQFQQAIQPNDALRAALDDLANASVKAAQDIKAACPTDVALTAATRLAAMKQRIEAMIAAVQTLQPPLETFYGLLSDEQKARITALSQDQLRGRTAATTGSLAQSCGAAPSAVTAWPTAEIDRAVRPTEAQRASLAVLQNATVKAAGMLETSCPADNPLTPPARLAAAGKRLDTMRQAVETVSAALDDFYSALNDEQKARFEAIGPQRTSQPDQPKARKTRARFIGGVGNELRRLLRSF